MPKDPKDFKVPAWMLADTPSPTVKKKKKKKVAPGGRTKLGATITDRQRRMNKVLGD